MLSIHHHERVERRPDRWRVHFQGRSEPVPVELPADARESLDLSDEQIHELLPTALMRRAEERTPDDPLPQEFRDATWEAPVRVLQTHFIA